MLYLIVVLLIILTFAYLNCKCKKIEIFTMCSTNNSPNLHRMKLYTNIKGLYKKIFPDNNRNAGGAQYFDYIVNTIKPNNEDFKIYNQLYCSVSGSLIDPSRNSYQDIVIDSINNGTMFGKQYICCSPCVCDMIKYGKVDTFTYLGNEVYVFVIDDPCIYENLIPKEVTSFQCNNGNTTNGILSDSGKLIIGYLHDHEQYDPNNAIHKKVKYDNAALCKERNELEPNQLKGGMGDIFVKLSLISNKEAFQVNTNNSNVLLNIYGEPLKPCNGVNETGSDQGSWDKDGYCSEEGGGVHQICMKVDETTSDFSMQTGQSDWSKKRIDNNHCMCLGAWSLYKAKQDNNLIKRTYNELQCESIPEMALSHKYIHNWNTWNKNELPNQIQNGVESLVKQCHNNEPDNKKKEYLLDKYNNLKINYKDLRNSNTFINS